MGRCSFSAILGAAALLALFAARPYAGSWNDGSRLAVIESLGDRGTFQIDDSIYVHPESAALPPYTPGDEFLARHGTRDKLFIDGHYYSDKSPVPAVLMAGTYRVIRRCGLPPARDRPDLFARVMTWLFAGVPYVLAVWWIGRIARRLGVSWPWDAVLTSAFAFGSLALPYAQHVNNHVLLLGVAAGVCDLLLRDTSTTAVPRRATIAVVGFLAGLGYTIDLGAGPLLLAAVGGFFIWRRRGALVFALGALPWVIAHHALNYMIAGTLGPANANPEFFRWPGSPFDESNMTGMWRHDSAPGAALYALDLLFGKKGFLLYSLPLVQAVFGLYWLLCVVRPERHAVVSLVAWAAGTWLLYAATSRNLSGYCLSIRWFVPLLAPGFVTLLILARDYPRSRLPLVVLVAGGFVLTLEGAIRGPWAPRVPILLWPVVKLTVAAWIVVWIRMIKTRTDGRGPRGPSQAVMTA